MSIGEIFRRLVDSIVETDLTGPITIKLEDLSRIWLPANGYRSSEPYGPSAPQGDQSAAASSKRQAIDVNRYKPTAFFESFWNQYMVPNAVMFEEGNLFPVASDLIDILTQEGTCPSVVVNSYIFRDHVATDLAKITLQKHSQNVAVKLLGMMDMYLNGPEARDTIPTAVIAALGHDIGKIPKYSSQFAAKHDHPYISADIIGDLARKHNAVSPRLDKAIQAIKMHHEDRVSGELAEKNRYINWLQIADEKAREMEIGETRRLPLAKDGAEWLDAGELLQKLKPHINVLETGGKQDEFMAFSFENTVYARIDSLYDIVMSMYRDKNTIVDILFEYQHSRIVELAKRQIVKRLFESKKLSHTLNTEHSSSGRWYLITRSAYKSKFDQTKFRLVPISVESFGCLPSELEFEQKKEGWLQLITSVEEST